MARVQKSRARPDRICLWPGCTNSVNAFKKHYCAAHRSETRWSRRKAQIDAGLVDCQPMSEPRLMALKLLAGRDPWCA
mgnify:CR=1 FL=1